MGVRQDGPCGPIRTQRRPTGGLVGLLLLALVGVIPSSATAADARSVCRVRNTDSGQAFDALHKAVEAAGTGDRLTISGTCVGGTVIDRDLVIEGVSSPTSGRATLSGAKRTRVLLIEEGSRAKLRALEIREGRARSRRWGQTGQGACTGALDCGRMGGGVENRGVLVLRDVVVRANTATFHGGAIFNVGTLTLNGATRITGNHSLARGGGIYNWTGTLRLNGNSRVADNSAATGMGGGVYNRSGTVVLHGGSAISGNTADSGGGAYSAGPRALLVLHGSSRIHGNTATFSGGGVYGDGAVTLNDASSIDSNGAIYSGGGLWSSGSVVLNDGSRVDGNTASGGAGITINGRGVLELNDGSLVTGNTAQETGGGIENYGTVTLHGSSSVVGNTSSDLGGGIYNYGTVTLHESSRVSDNTALEQGGGIWNGETVFLKDSSMISGNGARGQSGTVVDNGVGGGVYNFGNLYLEGASTITGNTAVGGGGVAYYSQDYLANVYVCGPSPGANVRGNAPDDCLMLRFGAAGRTGKRAKP